MSGYTFERHSGYCSLKFTAELGAMPWKDVEEATNRVTQLVHDDPSNRVLVDLSDLQDMPSGVVASLVRTWKGMDENSRRFVVVSPQEAVTSELEQSGLTSLWTVTENHDEAYQSLHVSAPVEKPAEAAPPEPAQPQTEAAEVSTQPFVFQEQKLFCAVQMNPVLMEMSWGDVEAATTEVVEQVKQAGEKCVLVDISPMHMINSGLVASLVRIWKACKESNRQFSLVSPNELVTEVLKQAGLWKLWSVVNDRDEAVYDLGVSKGARVEKRERRVLTLVAVSCALLSVLALAVMFANRLNHVGMNAQLNALLLAAAAIATGLVSVFKDAGWRRVVAGVAVAISLTVLSTLWFHGNPISFGRPPAPAAEDEKSEPEPEPEPEPKDSASTDMSASDDTAENTANNDQSTD